MKFFKLRKKSGKKGKQDKEKTDNSDRLLNKWEYNFVFTLIVLLVMATILDLGVSFNKILQFISL